MKPKSLLLHPLVLFSSVWLGVMGLYVLRLSNLLSATDEAIRSTVGFILIPYVLALGATTLYFHTAPKLGIRRRHLLCDMHETGELLLLKRRLKRWLLLWMLFSVVEIFVSGGIPLVWIFSGSSKTYFDFGIQSVHGLLNSMILALGLCYAGIFARCGGRRYLLCSLGIVAWAVLLITRSMMIVDLLQTGMVTVLYRGIPGKFAIKLIAVVLVIVIGFGAIGDLRTGAINFRTLAQPTEAYPDWLPSGVLWVYIYVTTPLNNLTYSMSSLHPVDNLLFPNTAAPLFPRVVRGLIYGDSLATSLSGELADSAFNVSTAYVGPFQDYGALGMACFSLLISVFAAFYWRRTNFRDQLIYIVIAQCLLMTVFFNHFFSLPIITQVIWIYLFFLKGPSKKLGVRQPTVKYALSSGQDSASV